MVKMRRNRTTLIVGLLCSLSAISFGWQGGQNRNLQEMDGSVQGIEQAISGYLNGNEIKSVLSPGEFSEFRLPLKAGQVVIAEANSDSFDPALEVVDSASKVLASNDDRYPGDQRPLLLWRCEKDGTYGLHIRCFHDRSGGQFFTRYRVYDTVDLGSDQKVEQDIDKRNQFLIRVPMKAGQIKEILTDVGTDHHLLPLHHYQDIAPGGLPDIRLSQVLQLISPNPVLVAPATGDYYMLEQAVGGSGDRGRVRLWAREILPTTLAYGNGTATSKSPANMLCISELNIKKGQFLQVSTPELDRQCRTVLANVPDISQNDLTDPDKNPFFPQPNRKNSQDNLPFIVIPKREGDNRMTVFHVWRDAKIWIASNGATVTHPDYNLTVAPAALPFEESSIHTGAMRIANTDYWSYDLQAGDVMTLDTKSPAFTASMVVRDPDMNEIRTFEANLDQSNDSWQMTARKSGRYLVAMSCRGNGGAGTYSLARKVLHPTEFSTSKPAKGSIGNGQIQIWRFTAKAGDPQIIHWSSNNWDYDVTVTRDDGTPSTFQQDEVDPKNRYGIIRTPGTYIIVLTGRGSTAQYSIELAPIPGYKKG